jgi:hypothetical protein
MSRPLAIEEAYEHIQNLGFVRRLGRGLRSSVDYIAAVIARGPQDGDSEQIELAGVGLCLP